MVQSFDTESYFDRLVVNGMAYSGRRRRPSGITPTTNIYWASDFSIQRSGWRLCVEAQPARSVIPRQFVTRQNVQAAPTPAPLATAKRFVLREGMSLKSDGTSDDVASSVAPAVASAHGVREDQVNVTAISTGLWQWSTFSQQWHVEYSLTLENESMAAVHLQIAEELAANSEGITQLLAQSFTNAGLTLDTTGFAIDATGAVDGDQSCYDVDVGLKDLFEDGCDTYERNPDYCGQYDDDDFSSRSMCCACGGGDGREPDLPTTTGAPILPAEPGCADTASTHKDTTGDGCLSYGVDPVHFCGEFDDDDFSSMGMCCSCHPYAAPTPAPGPTPPAPPGEAGPTPSPGSVLDGAAPHGLSAVSALVAGSACVLGGLVG